MEPAQRRELVLQGILEGIERCQRMLADMLKLLAALERPPIDVTPRCLHPEQLLAFGSCNDTTCPSCFTAAGKPRRRTRG